MIFNIVYRNRLLPGNNTLFVVSEQELTKFIANYNNGGFSFFFRGYTYTTNEVIEIKIYDCSKTPFPNEIDACYDFLMEEGKKVSSQNNYQSEWFLKLYGIDCTKKYIQDIWGSLKASSESNPRNIAQPASPADSSSINVDKLTLRDISNSISRLELKSALWLVSILIALIVGAYTFGLKINISTQNQLNEKIQLLTDSIQHEYSKDSLFQDKFLMQFTSIEHIDPIAKQFFSMGCDGLFSEDEVIASLLWQLKSQKGFASFLHGDTMETVQVSFKSGNSDLDWKTVNNPVPLILSHVNSPVQYDIKTINGMINTNGMAILDNNHSIVRDFKGGLSLIAE